MEQEKILITGGSGMLGTELKKVFPNAYYPTHNEFDITSIRSISTYLSNKNINVIVHAAANTNLQEIKTNPAIALETNIIGTANIVKVCIEKDIKIIYISTDYVFKGDKGNYSEEAEVFPVNKYAWSKLGGECAINLYENSLIIRTSFGKEPFPYDGAFIDQWTIREHVENTVNKIKILVESNVTGVIHIGGSKKSVYEYAKYIDSEKEIKQISIYDLDLKLPKDTSLSLVKYKDLFE